MHVFTQDYFYLNFIKIFEYFVGPAEFDEEKISIASATGPASDISAGSSNSNEVKSSAQGATGAASIAASSAAAASGGATSTNNSTGRKTSRLSLHGLNVASSMSSLIKQPIEGLKNSASSSLRNSSRVNSRSLLNLFSAHNNSTATTSTNPSNLTRQGNVIFVHSSRGKALDLTEKY